MDAREEQARLDWLRDLVESLALYADWGRDAFRCGARPPGGRHPAGTPSDPGGGGRRHSRPPPRPAVAAPRTAPPEPARPAPPAPAVGQPSASLLESAEEALPRLTPEEKQASSRRSAPRSATAPAAACRPGGGTWCSARESRRRAHVRRRGPGADEDRTGRPFVGRAGQLLDRMIEAMTLRREQVYIANVVKCRPPDNRTPEPEECATCGPFLHRQIEIIQPRVLVLLGSVAAQYVLGTRKSMGLLRGSVHRHRGALVIPTYHPAYLLRNPAAKRDVWEDLQKAMGLLGIPVPKRGGAPGGA